MPVLTGDIESDGALVDIIVGWSDTAAKGLRISLRPVPTPISARALLDSGAEITCVDSSLIQQLGLPYDSMSLVNVPAHGGITVNGLYDASLTIVHPSGQARQHLIVRNLKVLELSLSLLGYQGLIGRDVLSQCKFLYHGPRNKFRLAY
jgi:Retroviral aspartyl protease